MTREEISRSMECVLESDKRTIKNPISEYGWLFDKIYKWKKSLEQEPCEDAISREVVQKWYCQNCCGRGKHNCSYYPCNEIKDILNLPSVTPQPKTGHWIAVENEDMETVGYYCSECDLPMETENQTRFCPQCGSYNGGNDNGDE